MHLFYCLFEVNIYLRCHENVKNWRLNRKHSVAAFSVAAITSGPGHEHKQHSVADFSPHFLFWHIIQGILCLLHETTAVLVLLCVLFLRKLKQCFSRKCLRNSSLRTFIAVLPSNSESSHLESDFSATCIKQKNWSQGPCRSSGMLANVQSWLQHLCYHERFFRLHWECTKGSTKEYL